MPWKECSVMDERIRFVARIPRSYAKGFAATSEKVCVVVCCKMLTARFKSHIYAHSKLILRDPDERTTEARYSFCSKDLLCAQVHRRGP
jgi:hypothetical protein